MEQMLFPWLRIGASGLTALVLILTSSPKDVKLFTPANIAAIALASYAGLGFKKCTSSATGYC
jgi:DNA segregation ATPase FtsK/SpoIIIE, S-DNA-T family